MNVRLCLLALLSLGLVGTGVDLILLEHYETPAQWAPLALIAVTLAVLIWHGRSGGAMSVRTLQATMVLLLVTGIAGIGFHFNGGAEFQLEIDPAQSRWTIFKKVIHSKAPPMLAPGLMVYLGLLGLVYSYRHPALDLSQFRSQSLPDGVTK